MPLSKYNDIFGSNFVLRGDPNITKCCLHPTERLLYWSLPKYFFLSKAKATIFFWALNWNSFSFHQSRTSKREYITSNLNEKNLECRGPYQVPPPSLHLFFWSNIMVIKQNIVKISIVNQLLSLLPLFMRIINVKIFKSVAIRFVI